jgi:hypothetical protein
VAGECDLGWALHGGGGAGTAAVSGTAGGLEGGLERVFPAGDPAVRGGERQMGGEASAPRAAGHGLAEAVVPHEPIMSEVPSLGQADLSRTQCEQRPVRRLRSLRRQWRTEQT